MMSKAFVPDDDTDPNELGRLCEALRDRFDTVDWPATLKLFPSVDDVVARMLSALPDVRIDRPLIGACYSSPALARWKRQSRQAIAQQRGAGTLFGVKIGRSVYFPSAQFDRRGRQSQAFASLFSEARGNERDPVQFAVWLEAPDPETGMSPNQRLRHSPDIRSSRERLIDRLTPTIIEPPSRADDER